jgi:hypothetical protein
LKSKPIQKNAIVGVYRANFSAQAPFGSTLFQAAARGNSDDKEIARSRVFAYLDMLDMTDKIRAFCAHDYTHYLGYSYIYNKDPNFTATDPSGARVNVCLNDLPIAPTYYEGVTQVSNYMPVIGFLLLYRPTISVLREMLTPEVIKLIPQVVLDRAFVQYALGAGGYENNPQLLQYIKSVFGNSKLPSYMKSRLVPVTGREINYAERRRLTDPKEI